MLKELFNVSIGIDITENNFTLEVGDIGKNTSQVKHLDNYLVAADDIETGGVNKVPI